MVEVFKTNIDDCSAANRLLELIKKCFPEYRVNFDLGDCDRILRVQSLREELDPNPIVSILQLHGFQAEVLKDDVPAVKLPFEIVDGCLVVSEN